MSACHPNSWKTQAEIDGEEQKAVSKEDQQFDTDWANWRKKTQPEKSNSIASYSNKEKLLHQDNFWKIGKTKQEIQLTLGQRESKAQKETTAQTQLRMMEQAVYSGWSVDEDGNSEGSGIPARLPVGHLTQWPPALTVRPDKTSAKKGPYGSLSNPKTGYTNQPTGVSAKQPDEESSEDVQEEAPRTQGYSREKKMRKMQLVCRRG